MENFVLESDDSLRLKQIYERMQDDESRNIYLSRSLYSLTDQKMYMKNDVRSMVLSQVLLKNFNKHAKKEKVLFGAGTWGRAIQYYFPELDWVCYVDNKLAGKVIGNLGVISCEDLLRKYPDAYVVVSVLFKYREVEQQLLAAGIKKENMLILGRVAEEHQYFDLPEFVSSENEIFVDAGAYNGETTLNFIRWAKGKYKQIYAFEPNEALYELCCRNLAGVRNIKIISKGLWDKEDELNFFQDGEASMCTEEGLSDSMVQTVSIDGLLKNTKVTFLKMDIEGAELKALYGAEQIIRKYKPKLAICVYHCRQDIWDIPSLLLQYNPEYKFWLRIYSITGKDTVLYAM